MKKYDLLAVGELLADFIGTDLAESIYDTAVFHRFQGGSPSNLAANMARLGGNTAIVSCVGDDNLGKYLIEKVRETGVETRHIAVSDAEPSSIVVVARSNSTPDFIAYRTADRMIEPKHITDELLSESAIFHTTCFALSQNPAQRTIVAAAARASRLGCQLSIDVNYAPKIWADRREAQQIVGEYVQYGAFVKMSEDDAERLYGRVVSPDEAIADFHAKGAKLVCFTLGAKGSIVSFDGGKNRIETTGRKIDVLDSTGAGDAFWSGFLTAYLDGHNAEICANAATNMATKKLGVMGPLPSGLDKGFLYA